jgi:uncharacterized protein (TIGR02118 family)
MYRVLALYGMPTDPDHFRRYYESEHLPLARRMPGLRSLRHSFDLQALVTDRPYFCVAELEFDNAEAFQAALASEVGQATAADVGNYATGSVAILHYALPD